MLLDRLACAGTRGRVVGAVERPPRTPLVSVVVPCFNYGHYLPTCVGSVLGQRGVEVEAIVVDDASTDDSAEVADALARTDQRVRLIRHSRNAGHIATYNDGLAEANGDYVVLLSADDLLTPGSLRRATALMEAHPRVGLVYGPVLRFDGESPPTPRTDGGPWIIWSGLDWLATRFKRAYNCIFAPEAMLRTTVLREIGGYKAELPHTADMEVWMRAATISDVGYVSGAHQACYRDHGASMHNTTFQARESAGLPVDLSERMRTFELIAGSVPKADRWLHRARRALAIEALSGSIRSFYRGDAGSWPVDELAALALELYPDARRLPHWRILAVHRRIGHERPRRDPASIGHHFILRARGATRRWRAARAGL